MAYTISSNVFDGVIKTALNFSNPDPVHNSIRMAENGSAAPIEEMVPPNAAKVASVREAVAAQYPSLEGTEFHSSNVSPGAGMEARKWFSKAPYDQKEWIICEVVHLTCFFIGIYILYALIHFYSLQPRRHNYSGRSSGSRWLEKMCILAVILALMRFASNQVLLFTGWHSREQCSVLINVSIAMYFLVLHPVYLFLWIRQRIFYSNRALKHLYNRVVRFFSWATIFCFFVVTGVSMVLFVIDRKNSASGRVCRDHRVDSGSHDDGYGLPGNADNNVDFNGSFGQAGIGPEGGNLMMLDIEHSNTTTPKHTLKINTVTGLIGGGIQVSFLVLFLYPIMDNKLRAVRNLNMRCHHSLMKLIRRAFVLSGICIFSDVTIALGVNGVYKKFPEAVFAPIAMYDINLIINIVCIIATFRRWRRMLFPCLYSCCGGRFIRRSKKYTFDRRSAALDTTNGGNAKSLCAEEDPEPTKVEKVVKVEDKAPVVDVLLVSDGEVSDEDGKSARDGKHAPNGINEINGNRTGLKYSYEKAPEKMVRKNSRKVQQARRYTASAGEMPRVARTITMTNATPFYATSRFSLRSKKANNVVTTKLVIKSEAHMIMRSPIQEKRF